MRKSCNLGWFIVKVVLLPLFYYEQDVLKYLYPFIVPGENSFTKHKRLEDPEIVSNSLAKLPDNFVIENSILVVGGKASV